MSKKRIEAALRRKGLSCSTIEYNHQITPGEVVSGWDIELDDRSETAVADADPAFDDWDPDCFNAEAVLEWVSSLPDCRALNAKPEQTEHVDTDVLENSASLNTSQADGGGE